MRLNQGRYNHAHVEYTFATKGKIILNGHISNENDKSHMFLDLCIGLSSDKHEKVTLDKEEVWIEKWSVESWEFGWRRVIPDQHHG